MSIDWKIEIEKAESWAGKKECCLKYIDLAKQICDEATAYRSMWGAEFELRQKAQEELNDTKLDVDYYREKAIEYLEKSQGLTRSFAKDCVGNRIKGDWDDQSKS
jgi:hypothetical protein